MTKITQPIHCRIAVAIHRGQDRIRINPDEFERAAIETIRDPKDNKRCIAAFSRYEDTRGGLFAYFSEAYRIAARKEWHIDVKENK